MHIWQTRRYLFWGQTPEIFYSIIDLLWTNCYKLCKQNRLIWDFGKDSAERSILSTSITDIEQMKSQCVLQLTDVMRQFLWLTFETCHRFKSILIQLWKCYRKYVFWALILFRIILKKLVTKYSVAEMLKYFKFVLSTWVNVLHNIPPLVKKGAGYIRKKIFRYESYQDLFIIDLGWNQTRRQGKYTDVWSRIKVEMWLSFGYFIIFYVLFSILNRCLVEIFLLWSLDITAPETQQSLPCLLLLFSHLWPPQSALSRRNWSSCVSPEKVNVGWILKIEKIKLRG